MKADHPIIFSADMVRAIQDFHKTETRRVAKFTDAGHLKEPNGHRRWHRDDPNAVLACPYGVPGGRLWVRETWGTVNTYDHLSPSQISKGSRRWPQVWYGADPGAGGLFQTTCEFCGKVRPSVHMPRWASRITLEIVDIRFERLQEISEADCCAELGAPLVWPGDGPEPYHRDLRGAYRYLWDSLNAKRGYPWSNNPLVWVISFTAVKPEAL